MATPEDVKLLEDVVERLNILIALQLDVLAGTDANSTTRRVHRLSDLGLTPAKIGSIIGRKANYVSAVLGRKEKQ